VSSSLRSISISPLLQVMLPISMPSSSVAGAGVVRLGYPMELAEAGDGCCGEEDCGSDGAAVEPLLRMVSMSGGMSGIED